MLSWETLWVVGLWLVIQDVVWLWRVVGGEVRVMAIGELTEMQERFAQEYASSGNATASAINAGYSERSADVLGSRQTRNVKVMRRIREIREEQGIEVDTEKDTLLEMLTNIAESKSAEPQHKLKAIEMIAKIRGYYKDSPEINVDNSNTFNPNEMSDEELKQEMKKLEDEMGDIGSVMKLHG